MTNHETTNENGKAILTNFEAGEYNITILKDGFDTRNTTINVDEDHLEFNIVLNAHTSIIYYCEVLSGSTSLGDAIVQTTGREYNGYYEISVTDADDNSLIGEKYWISSEAVIDGTTSNNLFEDFNGTSTNLSITMSTSPRTFVLGITVTDGENALQGVSVTVNNETHTTGSAGGCSFNLTNGDYEATFTKEGYITKTENITVNGDTNSNIVMTKETATIKLTYDAGINRTFSTYTNTPFTFTGEYTVNYGDGSTETVNENKQLTHTYEDDEIYTIRISGNITELYHSCFREISGLKNIIIPNTITSIKTWCFSDCTALSSIIIPDSVIDIGNACFNNCTDLTSVTFSNNMTELKSSMFKGCTALTTITIPNHITKLGGDCFSGCTSLTNITLPNAITLIPAGFFRDCSSLTNIDIPNIITGIGNLCFYGCTNILEYNLWWDTNPVAYNNTKMPAYTNTKFIIPNGTTQLYIDAGYPSSKLVERSQ